MAKVRYTARAEQQETKGYDLVIDFFSNIGASREASMYLKMFRDVVPWQFAVVLISAESLQASEKAVALDLAYLCGLSLYPVIVLDNIQSAGGGLVRHSSPGAEPALRMGERIRRLYLANDSLVQRVTDAGGRATGIYNEIFSLRTPWFEDQQFDFRLLVDHLELEPIKAAVESRQVPIVSPVIMDEDGRLTAVSAEKVTKALCARIHPQKLIVISEQGGLLDREGRVIHNIILSTDYDSLVDSDRLDQAGREQLEAAVRLLREVPDLTLQIASAGNLLYELFTVKGRGSYMRAGHTILQARSWKELDLEQSIRLIEDAFGKRLAPDYFQDQPDRIFYERDYHGLIVVKPLDGDIFYLDKFVVGRQWQGEGMGAPLWRELGKYYGKLIWRANPLNPINRWYTEQADGFQRSGEWNIYWIGLTPAEVGGLLDRVKTIRRTVI